MKSYLPLIVAASTLLISPAVAADETGSTVSPAQAPIFTQQKPAVDGINGKVQVFGGATEGVSLSGLPSSLSNFGGNQNYRWYGLAGGAGTISIPVGHSFGIQLDGASGLFHNAYGGGGAGHFFWRDPDKGLIGAYGSGFYSAVRGGRGPWNAASEIEAYIGSFTVGGLIGAQGTINDTQNNFYSSLQSWRNALTGSYANQNPNRFFDSVAISYYPVDDLKVSLGHLYTGGLNSATVAAEYLLPKFRENGRAASVYGEAIIGGNNNSAIMGGFKIYFGNHDKTLIRRHREDDPAAYITQSASVGGSRTRRQTQTQTQLQAPPPGVVCQSITGPLPPECQ